MNDMMTFTINDADLDKLSEILKDINVKECPWFEVQDKHGVKAKYYREPRKKGRWIWNPNGMDWNLGAWCCSECKFKAETWWSNDEKYNPLMCSGGHFCGNCGADMRGAEND